MKILSNMGRQSLRIKECGIFYKVSGTPQLKLQGNLYLPHLICETTLQMQSPIWPHPYNSFYQYKTPETLVLLIPQVVEVVAIVVVGALAEGVAGEEVEVVEEIYTYVLIPQSSGGSSQLRIRNELPKVVKDQQSNAQQVWCKALKTGIYPWLGPPLVVVAFWNLMHRLI